MVRAIMMTEEQIDRLVEIACHDGILWASLTDRETNQFNEDGSAKIPSIAMIVGEFVRRQYGSHHNFDIGSLIIQLRFHIRQELGMPV